MKVRASNLFTHNGITTYAIQFEQATAHLDVRADGSVVPNHNLSALGLQEALDAIAASVRRMGGAK